MRTLAVGEKTVFLLLGSGQDLASSNSNIVAVGHWVPGVGREITGAGAGTTEIKKLDRNGAVLARLAVTVT